MAVTLKCKCGNSEMTFPHLKESDFPEGWESDCCQNVKEMMVLQGFAPEETVEAASEEPVEATAEVQKEPETSEAPKKKSKKK